MFKKIIGLMLLVATMLCVGCAKTEKDDAKDVGDALKVVADRFVTYIDDEDKIREAFKNGELNWNEYIDKASEAAKEAYEDIEKKTSKLEKLEVKEKVRPLKAKAIRVVASLKTFLEYKTRPYDTSPQMEYQINKLLSEFDSHLDDFRYDYYSIVNKHWN